jgi:hypothetical protein
VGEQDAEDLELAWGDLKAGTPGRTDLVSLQVEFGAAGDQPTPRVLRDLDGLDSDRWSPRLR